MNNRIVIGFTAIMLMFLKGTQADAQAQDTILNARYNYFFISPLPLFDVINPALSVGYERKYSEKYAFQLEGGPILQRSMLGFMFTSLGFGTRDAWWRNRGLKVRTEFKIYPKVQPSSSFKRYFACELFMTKNSSNVTQLYVVADSTYNYDNADVVFAGDGIYDDFYVIHRNRYGANFKMGMQEFHQKKMAIDLSFGVGVVYQTAHETGRTNLNDQPYSNAAFLGVGDKILPSLTVGIKIGIKNRAD